MLLRVSRMGTDGASYTVFYAQFEQGTEPTNDQLSLAQIKAGYHPAGYGGPWKIHVRKLVSRFRKVTWDVTWEASGNCD